MFTKSKTPTYFAIAYEQGRYSDLRVIQFFKENTKSLLLFSNKIECITTLISS